MDASTLFFCFCAFFVCAYLFLLFLVFFGVFSLWCAVEILSSKLSSAFFGEESVSIMSSNSPACPVDLATQQRVTEHLWVAYKFTERMPIPKCFVLDPETSSNGKATSYSGFSPLGFRILC